MDVGEILPPFGRLDDKLVSFLGECKLVFVNNSIKHPPLTSEVMLRKECPASLFEREAEVLCGALKTKSCLSVSEFFLFSGEKCRSSSKSADGSLSFLLTFSFC